MSNVELMNSGYLAQAFSYGFDPPALQAAVHDEAGEKELAQQRPAQIELSLVVRKPSYHEKSFIVSDDRIEPKKSDWPEFRKPAAGRKGFTLGKAKANRSELYGSEDDTEEQVRWSVLCVLCDLL